MNAGSKIGILNGLRGVAILLVLVHHLFIPFTAVNALHPGEIDADGLFARFVNDAWLGVNIFFVLSGFVLYLPYCTGRRTMNGADSLLQFYVHRAGRLMPLYYIIVLVTLGLHSHAPAGSQSWYMELGGLLTTLFIFSPHGFMPPSNVVLWSVGVEIWFSILFPGFVLLFARYRIGWVALATVATCGLFIHVGQSIPIDRVGSFRPFTSGIFGSCYEFILGMVVCKLYIAAIEFPKIRQQYVRLLLPGLLVSMAGVYLMHHPLRFSWLLQGSMLFGVGFSIVLLSLLSGAGVWRLVLESWTLQLLGSMCYSIYAWHGLVMNAMIPPSSTTLAETLRLLVPFLFVTFALSALSYRYIEFGRERNWKKLFLMGTPAADASEANLRPAERHGIP